eukprot:2545957-Pleurochrysis_carterae.AAC.1
MSSTSIASRQNGSEYPDSLRPSPTQGCFRSRHVAPQRHRDCQRGGRTRTLRARDRALRHSFRSSVAVV